MRNIVIIIFISLALIAPARGISCMTCNDCMKPQTIFRNQTCLTGQDTCMKLDFGQYIYKQCGTQQSMCTEGGFKNTNTNLYSQIQGQVGSTTADAEIYVNRNAQGRTVLNCCQDRDYCNSGMLTTLSSMAILGMTLTYLVA